jgi:hypothetical protein
MSGALLIVEPEAIRKLLAYYLAALKIAYSFRCNYELGREAKET